MLFIWLGCNDFNVSMLQNYNSSQIDTHSFSVLNVIIILTNPICNKKIWKYKVILQTLSFKLKSVIFYKIKSAFHFIIFSLKFVTTILDLNMVRESRVPYRLICDLLTFQMYYS